MTQPDAVRRNTQGVGRPTVWLLLALALLGSGCRTNDPSAPTALALPPQVTR